MTEEQSNPNRSLSGNVPGECQCECHRPGKYIQHWMECCEPCSICGLNISDHQHHKQVSCRGRRAMTIAQAVPSEFNPIN